VQKRNDTLENNLCNSPRSLISLLTTEASIHPLQTYHVHTRRIPPESYLPNNLHVARSEMAGTRNYDFLVDPHPSVMVKLMFELIANRSNCCSSVTLGWENLAVSSASAKTPSLLLSSQPSASISRLGRSSWTESG
jgi:hypothetical protein